MIYTDHPRRSLPLGLSSLVLLCLYKAVYTHAAVL